MDNNIAEKIRTYFSQMAIYKDPVKSSSLFAGRNLPAFVKDFIIKKYINADGEIDNIALTNFLDSVIPKEASQVKDKLGEGKELVVLTRFNIFIDLVNGVRRFGIPDMGIKINEGVIPDYVYKSHQGELVDGEKWGIIKLCVLPNDDGKKNHVEMVDFKPFKPYRSVDLGYWQEARRGFTTQEWIDVLLSAMEYDSSTFEGLTQKWNF